MRKVRLEEKERGQQELRDDMVDSAKLSIKFLIFKLWKNFFPICLFQ